MSFIQDLALILITAALVNMILGRFRMPIFIGYLFAGILVSSGVGAITPLVSSDNLKLWSEIGIIFLLFTIGLEFSLPEVLKLGAAPIKTGTFETLGTFFLVTGILWSFGLAWPTALGMGACFTISSTAIIMKSFQEYHLKSFRFVRHVFGILVFEDIAIILLLLILPTFAVSQLFSGEILVEKALQILSFLFISLIIGYFLLTKIKKHLNHFNQEALLIFSSGFGLFLASLSQKAGLSFGLGAFIAGSLLAQLPRREAILHSIESVRNLFLAIFFVATGMLLKVDGLSSALLPALGLSLLIIFIKFVLVGLGSLLSRESLKNSLRSALAMTAMGEFTLLTAQICLNLKLIETHHFQIIVLTCFIIIFIYTFGFKISEKLAILIESQIPHNLRLAIESYRQPSNSPHLSSTEIFKRYYLGPLIFQVLIICIIAFITHKWSSSPELLAWQKSTLIFISLLLCLPFFWGILFYQPHFKLENLEKEGDRLKRYQGVFFIARMALVISLFLFIGKILIGLTLSFLILTSMALILKLLHKELSTIHSLASKKLFESLDLQDSSSNSKIIKQTLWEAQVSEVIVSPNSIFSGKTLIESQLRERYHVLITAIDRGEKRIYAPHRDERIFPYDRLFVVGTESDLIEIRPLLEAPDQILKTQDLYDTFGLESYDIPKSSKLIGQTIRHSFFRNEGGSLIIGIERQGQKILNPDSSFELLEGDRLWLVGEQKDLIKKLKLIEKV